MTQLHIEVDSAYFRRIQNVLGTDQIETISEALTILNWVIDQRLEGKVILAVDDAQINVHRLTTRNIDYIKKI